MIIAGFLLGPSACAHADAAGGAQRFAADPAKQCSNCDAWNTPLAPFRVYGNTYYVGPEGLASVLIATSAGLILLDGALPQSAPLIAGNIEALGFELADLRLIVTSHTHYDHVGGVAALARASGARVAASPRAAEALRAGWPHEDDPQFTIPRHDFPPVADVDVIADGERLQVGDVTLTAHFTPGHTPGGTSWSWRSCEEDRCLAMVYADSLNAVAADGFRFTAAPGRVEEFAASIARVEALDCDILLSPHPGQIGLEAKLEARRTDPSRNPFIDPAACAGYAQAARERLERRVGDEARPEQQQ